jgi:alpha-amylase
MSSSLRTRPRARASGLAAAVALATTGALVAGAVAFSTSFSKAVNTSATAPAAAPSASDDVIANLFEWNWPSVATECTTVLGPNGYGAVQVAPPQDSIRLSGSHPWWDVYQPVGYDLNSRMGTEAQFASMVSACHAAGVKVYVDAVINHAAGSNQTSTDSYGGDSFNPATYTYGTMGYASSNFHFDPPCPNSDLSIKDWNNVTQVQECQLVGLSDLYTEQDYVRSALAGYLNKLEGYGVDGFRVDSAKHIAQADMAAILAKTNNTTAGVRPYVYQEVMPGGNGQLAPAAFESNGNVLGFDYAYGIRSAFLGSISSGLQNFGNGFEPSSSDTVMVTNHDLERNGSALSYKDGATYTLATEFELAYGWGSTPQVYSGFDYSNNDQSPPADANGFVTGTVCGTGVWECLDRNQGVANLVGFHNTTRGQAVGNWWGDGNNAIAFSRGSAGWVSINNENSTVSNSYQTGLPAGTYCDLVHGNFANGTCSGPTVVVSASGTATVTTAAKDAVAIDVDAVVGSGGPPPTTSSSSSAPSSPSSSASSTPPSGQVAETFTVTGAPSSAPIYLVGSVSALGNWAPASAIPLAQNGSQWSATVDLPASTAFQYKYIAKDANGNVTWELDPNHSATTGTAAATLSDTWHGASSTVSATFSVNATTWSGQNVYVVGSVPALGSWNTANAVALSSAAYPVWSGTVTLPPNTAFEYKYIKKDPDGSVEWESGANRTYSTGASGTATLNDAWSGTASPAPVKVTFDENKTTVVGQNVYVVGDITELGGWNTADAVPLSSAKYPMWSAAVSIPQSESFQYKYVVIDGSGNVTWESGVNRSAASGTAATLTLNDTWK